MALSRERMMERMLASDSAYNGRFFTGVLTTGIYCLPSCPARKPKPENVKFFASTADAREAGLRACKICRPDEFERGEDPDLDRVERLGNAVRRNPELYKGVEEMADELCFSVSSLHQAFRQHYQSSPGAFLVHARIEAAKRHLLSDKLDAGEVAFAVGFDSLSGFYESFKKATGTTPNTFRGFASAKEFDVAFPEHFCLAELLSLLARDGQSLSERHDGLTSEYALHLSGEPALLRMRFHETGVSCSVTSALEGVGVEAYNVVARLLNLRQDPSPFEKQLREMGMERLIAGREGLRISQTATIWDAIVWVILGQQVNLKFAATMKRALTDLSGTRIGDLACLPTPEAVARLDAADLQKIQFSRQKADYLLGISREIVSGDLDLAAMQGHSATGAEKRLRAVRGFGTWSVNYLMMRALGFGDCVPVGDTGLTSGLRKLHGLETKPTVKEIEEMMRPFAPYRSLATYHLWRT
jgi:AraC family transcriptional regulator of adaptative response / DNA-3-methyladenine glycosylase II